MGEASPILPCSRAHEEPPLTAHSHDSQMDWEFPYFVFCVLVACIALSKHSEGNGTPLQYSCLENPMDRGAWWAACSPWGHEELDTNERLHFHFHFHALEKEMATHSSVLAWRILGTGEPGGLLSMGSHRVGHD